MNLAFSVLKKTFVITTLVGFLFIPVLVVYAQAAQGLRMTADPASAPDLKVGTDFSMTFTANGGTRPYRWSEPEGLPAGLIFRGDPFATANNDNTRTISGKPTTAGNYSVKIVLRDAGTGEVTKIMPFKVLNADGTPPPADGGGGGGGSGNGGGSGSEAIGSFTNLLDFGDIPSFLVRIITIMLSVTGTLAVLFMVIGGLRMITSAGDSGAVTAAKNTIKYALFGFILAVLSFAIVRVIETALIN